MATIVRDNDILILTGSDVVKQNDDGTRELNRTGVRRALFDARGPLGSLRGKFDFIVCFTLGSTQVDHSGENLTLQPRPLRGIIQIPGRYTDMPLSEVPSVMGWFNHECGHHWLVPGRMSVRTRDGDINVARVWGVNNTLAAGGTLPPFPLLGRGNRHWSPYVDADNSCMEGNGFAKVEHAWGKDHVTGKPIEGVPYVFASNKYNAGCRYSELDLYIMGALNRNNIDTGHRKFGFIQPEWVVPLPFQSGLYVEMADGHRWFFGFHEGPQTIHAEAADPAAPVKTREDQPYVISKPFNPYDQVGLRMVQIDDTVALQYRVWGLARGSGLMAPFRAIGRFLSWPGRDPFAIRRSIVELEDVYRDLTDDRMETDHDPRVGWRTYAVLPGHATRTGLASRTLTDTSVYSRLSAKLGAWLGGNVLSVPTLSLDEEFPVAGPGVTDEGQFIMPFSDGSVTVKFSETNLVSEAPKLIWDVTQRLTAPRRDHFAFGGLVNLESCLFVMHAGGAGRKKTIIGDHQEIAFRDLLLSWTDEERTVRQSRPLDGFYRSLVCLVAEDAAEITGTRRAWVDLARRHWEPASHAMSLQLLETRTAIDPL